MTNERRCLFVGGPSDGQLLHVRDDADVVTVVLQAQVLSVGLLRDGSLDQNLRITRSARYKRVRIIDGLGDRVEYRFMEETNDG